MLIGQKPDIALSGLVRDIKAGSSGFINRCGWIRGIFTLSFPVDHSDPLHSESRKAPCEENFSAGISGATGEVSDSVRPEIHLQAR